MKIAIFLVVFFLAAAFTIISNNNLHIGNSEELNKFMGAYYGWFFQMFDNIKSVTGYVVNVDWMP